MIAALVLVALYSTFAPHANPGTYSVIQDGSSIVRMDTRTGAMERCSLETLACVKQI